MESGVGAGVGVFTDVGDVAGSVVGSGKAGVGC